MRSVAIVLAAAAALAAAAPAPAFDDAEDGKSEVEKRLEEVLAELEAQRQEINLLKARLNAPQEGGLGEAVKQYLESEDGKKSLDKNLFDGGFVKTGMGSLKITALLQAWYTSQRSDGTGAARKGVDTFRIRRAEVSFSGSVVKDLVDFKVMIDPARSNGNDETVAPTSRILQDLTIVYKGPFGLPKDMMFTVGQFKFPFAREGLTSSSKLDFIDRAEGSKAFSDARRAGAMIQGAPLGGALEWWLNVHNTRGQNSNQDNNDEKNYVARLAVNPFQFGGADDVKARREKMGDLGIGLSYMAGAETDAAEEFHREGVDAEWRKSKLLSDKDGVFLRTEWFLGDSEMTLAKDQRSRYYAAGYRFDDNWEVVARQEEFNNQAGDLDQTIHTLGLNYFIKGNNAKITFNYVRMRTGTATDRRTLAAQYVLQFQVAF